jgi:outer membrane protein assembly factor BamD
MTLWLPRPLRVLLPACAVLVALSAAACGGKKDIVPTNTSQVDKFLYEKGTEALNKKRWYSAREYFQRLVDNYPQSPFRPDAKIGVGDAYLGEATTESLTLGINEFKEFLTFYPTHGRADYAQYKLGLCHYRQMKGPQRDQSETRQAVQEFQAFVEKYPNSQLLPDAQEKLRESRDRLSTSEYQVGYFYFKQRWYPGAIERLRGLAKADPGFTDRDAVYFYLGESLMKMNMAAEAIPYYDRLTKEFDSSEFLARARERMDAYKPIVPPAGAARTPGGTATPSTVPPGPAPETPAAPEGATPATSDVHVPQPAPPPTPPRL